MCSRACLCSKDDDDDGLVLVRGKELYSGSYGGQQCSCCSQLTCCSADFGTGSLMNHVKVSPKLTPVTASFPFQDLFILEKPGPENNDVSDTDDYNDEYCGDDDVPEEENDAMDEDFPVKQGEDGDPEDDPEANGDGGGDDEDGDGNNDDDDNEDTKNEEEEEAENEDEEEAENEQEEEAENQLRTLDLLLSRVSCLHEEMGESLTDYEKLMILELFTQAKDFISNFVTGNRDEDILRLIHGGVHFVVNHDPICLVYFNGIYDQMVELKQLIDHTYSAVMRTSKSRWSELPTDIGESILKKFVPPSSTTSLFSNTFLALELFTTHGELLQKRFVRTLGFLKLHGSWFILVANRPLLIQNRKKVYEIQNVYGNHHHDFSDVRCKGSSHGWMVVFHMNWDVRESLAYVVNPITRARTEIPGKAALSDSEWHSVEITKVVLSSNPSSNNFSVIVAYYTQTRFVTGALAFCKYGDTSWSKLDYPHKYIFHDILFHHDHLFALTKKQSLYVWDFTESYPKMIFNIADTTPLRSVGRSYLVESMGEVLRVVRGGENTNSAHFLVEKLNVKDKKWEKVQNLGDQSLFLFHDQSMSLPKTCFLGSEDNSIYFLQGGWLARGVINRYNLETTEVRRINSLSDLIGKE